MASNAEAAGNSLKTKKPQCGNTEASEINAVIDQENNVMGDNSTNVIPFNFGKQQVRTLLIDGEPWFAAQDVLDSLEYAETYKPSRAMSHVPDAWKGVHRLHTPGGTQQTLMISEQGLYFVLGRSDKPKALPFQMWLAGDVLPAIRKSGRYDDQQGRLATLIGQTIGTDGFRVLGAIVKGKVASLPAPVQRRATAKIWSQVHAAFGVRSAADIPAEHLDGARNFIAAYNVLEGEFIPARSSKGITLDQYETHDLYLLMSHFRSMQKRQRSVLAAAEALESKLLLSFFDHLNDGAISFSYLDKRRDEIYAAYTGLGLKGGYAQGAAA